MAEPQFTPGPWTYRQSIETVSGASYPIAKIKVPRTGDELRANARLISAAPDLYAALEYIFEHIADKERGPRDLYPAFGLDARRAIEMASAALSKARGDAGKFMRGGEPG